MNLAEKAFTELYPEKPIDRYTFTIRYSGKFSSYNGNVKYRNDNFIFKLSRQWQGISEDIQMGLIQSLMNKVFKTRIKTTNIDLYNLFLKNVHHSIEKQPAPKELEDSFLRVNEKYFLGLIDQPNIGWGNESFRKLGCYSYGQDKITISTIFKDTEPEDTIFLDYIMYHELLHKKHKFTTNSSKNYHHTKVFKDDEKKFQAHGDIEKQLNYFIRKKKRGSLFKKEGDNKTFLERLFDF